MNCGWVITVRPLNVRNQAPLGAGVAVDVALGRFDRPMSREQLDVAQAAAGAVDVAGRHRDEAAPSGVRRAAFVAELLAAPLDKFDIEIASLFALAPAPWD